MLMTLFYLQKQNKYINHNFNKIFNNIMKQKNVLGTDLQMCNENPMTGFFRDGCCNTNKMDVGRQRNPNERSSRRLSAKFALCG